MPEEIFPGLWILNLLRQTGELGLIAMAMAILISLGAVN
jgi:ribose/xylose/arabinose/galactoside ABC-type transport system permease subunit